MIPLRPYQAGIQNRVRKAMEAGKRAPLVVAPCGSGKTVLFCDYTQKVAAKGKRTIILSHREELVEQISECLKAFDVDHSFIAAGRSFKKSQTHVASVMSLARRLGSVEMPHLIIIDEAHHGVAGSWKKVLDFWPNVRRVGFTATPQRLSGEPLGEIFDDLIVEPDSTAARLIEQGFLSPYFINAPEVPKIQGVRAKEGSTAWRAETAKRRKPTIVGDAVANYARYAAGKRAVVFEVSLEAAKATAASFQAAGFRAACIDGTMSRVDRRENVQMFRDHFIDVLVTCELVSEGFDLPAVEVAIFLRPTESLSLLIQQFGRALRPYPGKERAIILDHANNVMNHLWVPEVEMEWSLEGVAKRPAESEYGPQVRRCAFCRCAQYVMPGINACKDCGVLFSTEVKSREIEKVEGELVPLDAEMIARMAVAARIEQGRAQSFVELVELGRKREMKNPVGWARNVWAAREKKEAEKEAARKRQGVLV